MKAKTERGLATVQDSFLDKMKGERIEQIEKELNCPPDSDFLKNQWTFSKSINESASAADAIIVLTEWNQFKSIDWEILSSKMRSPAWLFDTRSICNLSEAKKYGLNIWRVGADPDMIN